MEAGAASVLDRQPDILRLAAEDGPPLHAPSGQIVARSGAMREVVELASRVARLETPVLIEGEPGVGKDVVARYVHGKSRRRHGPFVRVVCASFPESEVEERLFGQIGSSHGVEHRRPPSLLEAHRGTLVLDEVSRLPLWAQTRLLDVLQLAVWAQTRLPDTLERGEGPSRGSEDDGLPDVRLMATTECDLEEAASHGRFDQGLYYYLSVVRIHVPPLRHRQEDIRALAQHYLLLINSTAGRLPDGTARSFSDEAWDCLLGYDWPGNAPQLASVVARAAVLADSAEIGPECLKASMGEMPRRDSAETVAVPMSGGLTAMELAIVEEVIHRCRGNKAAAARTLRLHRRTLYRILKKRRPR
jgi:DNA-binding NtrC family response regulator